MVFNTRAQGRRAPIFRTHFAVVAALIALSVSAWAQEVEEDSDVVVLTQDNFDSIVTAGNQPVMVEFYAPWCGHCKNLAPIWEETATTLKPKGVVVGKIDCTANKDIASRYGVSGYPTLKTFMDGEVFDYDGPRNVENFKLYMARMMGPIVHKLDDADKSAKFLRRNPVSFVLFVEGGAAQETKDAFKTIASKNRHLVSFGEADSASFSSSTAWTPSADGVWVIKEDGHTFLAADDISEETLAAFVHNYRLPILPELGPDNFKDITKAGRHSVISVVASNSRESDKAFLKRSAAVAKQNQERFRFAWLDGVEWDKFLEKYSITKAQLPVTMVLDWPNEMWWVLFEGEDEATISTFLDNVETGVLLPQGAGLGAVKSWYLKANRYLLEENPIIGVSILGAFVALIYMCCCGSSSDSGKEEEEEEDGQKPIEEKKEE